MVATCQFTTSRQDDASGRGTAEDNCFVGENEIETSDLTPLVHRMVRLGCLKALEPWERLQNFFGDLSLLRYVSSAFHGGRLR